MTSEPPQERADLVEALGGAHGLADSSLPGLAFVIAYTASGQELEIAIWTAIAVAVGLTAVRLARRETLQFALSGLLGVGIAAFIASRTGRAEDFFLPGLLFNAAYAAAYAISIWIRWPLIGVIVGPLVGEGMDVAARSGPRAGLREGELGLGRRLPAAARGAAAAVSSGGGGGARRRADGDGLPVFAVAIWLTFLVLRQGGEIGHPEGASERAS